MRLWVTAALAALAVGGPAAAATYTVSPGGSDGNDGTSAPFRTLSKAVSVLRDGDTILLKPGTYAAGAWIERRNVTLRGEGAVVLDGGSASRNDGLTFYSTGGITVENVTIRGARRMGLFCVLSDGLTVRNSRFIGNVGSGLLTGNTHNVRIESCEASGNGSHGVYLSQSGDRLTVRNCTLFGNQRAGLQINAVEGGSGGSNPSTDSISEECLVENNTIHGNGAAGGSAIQLMSVRRSVIQNNLVYGNLAGGISLWDDSAGANYGCKQNKLLHNTVAFQSGRGRYGVQISAGSTGNELLNNILACGSGPALEADEPVRSDYNCLSAPSAVNNGTLAAWQRSTGNDLHSQEGNPGLTGDYRPGAGSRAIDGALLVIPVDKDGGLRPQGPNPDVGCYEAGAGGGGGTPPPPGTSGSFVIYGDAVAPGWTLSRWRSTVSTVADPVSEGSRSMAFTVTGRDGYLTLTGPGVGTSGRTHLKLMVHGGKRGGQELRLRAFLDGQPQSFTVNLRNYGGLPPRGEWIQYAVPLADLEAHGRSLTGMRLFAGRKQPKVYVDFVRVE